MQNQPGPKDDRGVGKKVAFQFKHTQKKKRKKERKEKKRLRNQIPKRGCLWKMNSTGTDSKMFYRMCFRLAGDALSLRVIKRNPASEKCRLSTLVLSHNIRLLWDAHSPTCRLGGGLSVLYSDMGWGCFQHSKMAAMPPTQSGPTAEAKSSFVPNAALIFLSCWTSKLRGMQTILKWSG